MVDGFDDLLVHLYVATAYGETPGTRAIHSDAHDCRDRGLNTLADKGDFLAITKKINGGTNGLVEREELYGRALKVLQ